MTKKLIALAMVVGIPATSFAITAIPTLVFQNYFAASVPKMFSSIGSAKHKRELTPTEQTAIVREVEAMKAIEVDTEKHDARIIELLWIGSDVGEKADILGRLSDYMAIKTGDASITLRSANDGHVLATRDNDENLHIAR